MSVLKRFSHVIIAVVLFVGIAPAGLLAQTSNGTIAGSVVDAKDNVLPMADVKAVSPEFGALHQTQTDSAGTYRLESLQPGVYNVTISLSGFTPLQVSNVVVNGSATTTVNGKLELAAAQNLIEIQAPASQAIDTQSGQLGETLNHQEISQLPYFSLNPAELAFTLPGVHDTPQGIGAVNTAFTEGIEYSVNGSRPRANNFLIDGQDDNDYGITGQAYQPTIADPGHADQTSGENSSQNPLVAEVFIQTQLSSCMEGRHLGTGSGAAGGAVDGAGPGRRAVPVELSG